jgi:hypothetical protein
LFHFFTGLEDFKDQTSFACRRGCMALFAAPRRSVHRLCRFFHPLISSEHFSAGVARQSRRGARCHLLVHTVGYSCSYAIGPRPRWEHSQSTQRTEHDRVLADGGSSRQFSPITYSNGAADIWVRLYIDGSPAGADAMRLRFGGVSDRQGSDAVTMEDIQMAIKYARSEDLAGYSAAWLQIFPASTVELGNHSAHSKPKKPGRKGTTTKSIEPLSVDIEWDAQSHGGASSQTPLIVHAHVTAGAFCLTIDSRMPRLFCLTSFCIDNTCSFTNSPSYTPQTNPSLGSALH